MNTDQSPIKLAPIKLGISTCLLGQNVRYDGGHKHDRFLTGTLGLFVTYVPVCPEVECGMGIPRESLRLVGDIESPPAFDQQNRKRFHRSDENLGNRTASGT